VPTEPPVELVETLSRLELATPEQVHGMAPRVRRLARDLPLFESVWIDALSQARILTPYQAAEINAGRADQLRIGSLLLCRKLASNGLGEWFIARDTRLRSWWRLMRVAYDDRPVDEISGELETLLAEVGHLDVTGLLPPRRAGVTNGAVWAACQHVDGVAAADWLAQHGRLPPDAVLEIARQMMPGLVAIEASGRTHGDLAARQLLLCGHLIALPLPGVRAIVRPAEGYSRADLPPEAFDGLAPQRVLEGTPPTIASDLFALGCLWWHLLTGRTPLTGGDALSKLRSAQTARIADVRSIAPDTPAVLADAIAQCLQADPAKRPASMRALAGQLGESSRSGKSALGRCLARTPVRRSARRTGPRTSMPAQTRLPSAPWMAAAAMALLAMVYAFSGSKQKLPLNSIAGTPHTQYTSNQQQPTSTALPTAVTSTRSAGQQVDVEPTGPADLVLSADRPLTASSIRLLPGQKVRGRPGARPLVVVPLGGLLVDCEDVTFENIDFVGETAPSSGQTGSLLQLRAYRLTLRGCSFQSAARSEVSISAIHWSQPPTNERTVQLPTGVLKLTDCVFASVAAAIDGRLAAAERLELVNCLHLGPGPLVKRSAMPKPDEPCLLSLEHCTVREALGVLCVMHDSKLAAPGAIEIRAVDCALLPIAGSGLLEFSGAADPLPLAPSIQWTGQGSLLGVETPVAVWRQPYDQPRMLAEDHFYVSGLVRSRVEFAGSAGQGPQASRLVRWQAPLSSPDPPGITEAPLYLPAAK
jgi:serine/threonine-protein kinase